jgi:hypothetical protein
MKKILPLIFLPLAFGWSTSNSSPAAKDSFRSRFPGSKEAQELLSVACKGPTKTLTFELQESTCTPCPFDRSLNMGGDFAAKLKLETVLYGRFLNVKETNALIDTSMCEAYNNNFGGTIILRWTGAKTWEFVRYESGIRSNDCLKYNAKAGHDLRVCLSSKQNVGFQSQRFETFDNTRPIALNAASNGEALVKFGSNLEDCENPNVDDFQVARNERKDFNRDGRPDFRLQISERHAQRSKIGECEEQIQWGKTKTLTLEFLFDGTQFKATSATKPIVKYLGSFEP